MKEKNSGKQMSINLIASIVSFCVNMGINFFLAPFLVKELGTEAYGFIGLSLNFIQYATIITAALNSISGRFISIEYHRGNIDKASKIFSSVFVADIFLATVMLVASLLFTMFIDVFLNVPSGLLTSVQITFGLAFLAYVISVVTAIFTTATFVKNRLDINSIRDIISNLIKLALVAVLFIFFPPQLYYLALATVISGMFLLLANISVKKKIMPDVKVKIKNFSFAYVKMILAAGIWVSFSQLCNVLISGLDLLICNLVLGPTIMGLYSIAKTVPTCLSNLINMLGNVFTPHYTIMYAKGDIDGLVQEVKFTSKIISTIMTVPLAGFIIFGNQFYTLWQPTKTADEILMIQILSVLTCLMYLFTCHTQCLMMLYTVCNKLVLPVFVNFGIGLSSVGIVLLVLNFGTLGNNGVYVIAAVSSVLMSIRALTFMPIYSAKILNRKWNTFYDTIIRGCICFAIIAVMFYIVSMFITINSWFSLIAVCIGFGLIGYALCIPLMFKRSEIKKLTGKFMKKIKH